MIEETYDVKVKIGEEQTLGIAEQRVLSLDELKNRLIPVFEVYNIKRAVLFGSYSRGEATPKSDVDILVDSGLKGLKFIGFIEDVKQSVQGRDVDVFDVSHVNRGSLIEKEIRETGVEIYAK